MLDAAASDQSGAVASYGRVYIDFALEKGALFDLMFASPDLRGNDDDLIRARAAALGALDAATRSTTTGLADSSRSSVAKPHVADLTLVRWALAHGIAVLLRTGTLQDAAGVSGQPSALGHRLINEFASEE